MKRAIVLAVLVVAGALLGVGCGGVDARVIQVRLDEIATLGSEAKTPGPRSAAQVASIESQVRVLSAWVKEIAR